VQQLFGLTSGLFRRCRRGSASVCRPGQRAGSSPLAGWALGRRSAASSPAVPLRYAVPGTTLEKFALRASHRALSLHLYNRSVAESLERRILRSGL
jgi:hypothetical protein